MTWTHGKSVCIYESENCIKDNIVILFLQNVNKKRFFIRFYWHIAYVMVQLSYSFRLYFSDGKIYNALDIQGWKSVFSHGGDFYGNRENRICDGKNGIQIQPALSYTTEGYIRYRIVLWYCQIRQGSAWSSQYNKKWRSFRFQLQW